MTTVMDTSTSKWRDEVWLAEANRWIANTLNRLGSRPEGPTRQTHVRPWSTVLEVPTSDGTLWFKANGSGGAHESSLLRILARWAPRQVVAPLAVEEDRGWFLIPNAGQPFDATDSGSATRSWETAIVNYARLQRAAERGADDLLAAGVPDVRPEAAGDHLAILIAERPYGMTTAEHRLLVDLLPTFRQWCTRLSDIGVPPTVQHDDLHSGNVFSRTDGATVFIDWADGCVSHPFGSLLHPERELVDKHGFAVDGPEATRLRDAYFQAWLEDHDRASLEEARVFALRITCVVRALAWRRAVGETDRQALKDYYATPESRWLRKLLEAEHTG